MVAETKGVVVRAVIDRKTGQVVSETVVRETAVDYNPWRKVAEILMRNVPEEITREAEARAASQ